MSGTVLITSAGRTDVGLRRVRNEDSHLAAAPVFLVADGMGGHADGAAASAAVVDAFRSLVGREDVSPEHVAEALDDASNAVGRLTAAAGRIVGTTASGVVLVRSGGTVHWLCLNIGDSRTYRYANGVLEQVSVDHSVVQELIDQGEITPEAAEHHPDSSVITRSITPGGGEADFWLRPVEHGERLLLCTDGLTRELGDPAIAALLGTAASADATADALVAAALEHGARDNITVVVLDVDGGQDVADDTRPVDSTRPVPIIERS